MNKNLKTTLALAVVAAFLATPVASAQGGSTLTITDISGANAPIVPDAPGVPVKVEWTYTVDSRGYELNFGLQTSATLTWQQPRCDDDQVFVTGSLTATIPLGSEGQGGTPGTTYDGESNFQIAATVDAQGEKQIRCTFQGNVAAVGPQANVGVDQSNSPQQDKAVVVDYFGLIQAKSAGRLKEAAPQKTISYDITVSNFGNSRTNVNFALLTESIGKWQPIVPEPIILESKASGLGGDEQPVVFQISTPFKNGWNNDERTFQLAISPSSTKDPNKEGNEVQVNVLGRVRGVYVPTLEPLAMLGAVIGAAMIARLRKDEE